MTTLNIIPATRQVKKPTLLIMLYGDPGAGKTTIGFSASPNSLLLASDEGWDRAQNRTSVFPCDTWDDFQKILEPQNKEMLEQFDTIIVDTIGKMQEVLQTKLLIDPKMRIASTMGLSMLGWSAMGNQAKQFFKQLRGMGKNIVLLAHTNAHKKPGSEDLKATPRVSGQFLKLLMEDCESIGYIHFDETGQRVLSFAPNAFHEGKDPAGIGVVPVPRIPDESITFLGDIISTIKTQIQNKSTANLAIQKAIADYIKQVEDLSIDTPMLGPVATKLAININTTLDRGPSTQVRRALFNRMSELGHEYDQTLQQFVPKIVEPVQTTIEEAPAETPAQPEAVAEATPLAEEQQMVVHDPLAEAQKIANIGKKVAAKPAAEADKPIIPIEEQEA